MSQLQQTQIIKRILLLGIISGVIALLLAFLVLGFYEFSKIKQETVNKLESQTDMLIYDVGPALMFDDKDAADKTLESLRSDRSINRIRIYNAKGKRFTTFVALDKEGDIHFKKSIVYRNEKIGRLEIDAQYVGLADRLKNYIFIVLIIFILSIPITYILSAPLRNQVSRAVVQLAEMTTSLERSNEEIRSAKMAAENASRAKSEFLATMSHELRTPLNAIIGFSEILKAQSFGALNDKQKDYITDVWESGKYLLSLINDILDLSKVEAGKMELELSEFNLQTILPNCLVMVKERALNRGIEISMNIDESLGSIVADERKLKQIINNLLSNAIKFTPENGRICFDIKRKNDKEILFSILDNGIGIEEKDREKIFQEFIRIDNSYSRKSQGTGLGLVLTKKFVELHGGKIWFESEGRDKGTRFNFILPVAVSANNPRNEPLPINLAGKEEVPAGNQNKPLVLLIEDDPKSAKLIAGYLQGFGYVLDAVTSGEEGLKKARELMPSLIILDIILPHKNGWDVLIELKMDPLTKDIPILVTSVLHDQQKGLTLGAVDYLVKPVSKEDLERAVARVPLSPNKSKPKILAIDDDETSLNIMETILVPKGFEVVKVQDSRKGIERISKERPDLVLLDLLMPVMTGFDILFQIRNNPSTKDMPVILVTAKSLTEKEKQAMKSQAQMIIEKSRFDKAALLKEINLMMGVKNQGDMI